MTDVVIVAAARTAIGKFGGTLAKISAPDLGAHVIRGLLEKTGVKGEQISEVILGQVLTAGSGQNPARQSVIKAGLPAAVPALTINKVCGSGLKAVMLADQAIRLGEARLVVAGGMESMSRAPYLLARAREGYRLGHGESLDSVIVDGLWDAYGMQHMGSLGDLCAREYHFTRQEQDDYAIRSHQRARQAIADGVFDTEIAPVNIPVKGGVNLVDRDEGHRAFFNRHDGYLHGGAHSSRRRKP